MTQYVKEKVEKIERPITAWALLIVIGILGCAYGFFVAGAIANALAAKDMTAQASSLTASLGELESKYLSAKSSIDLSYAKSNGFLESAAGTIYISKAKTPSLSLNR